MEAAITLTDQSGVGDARRRVMHLSKLLAFSEKRQADAALVVTEAATNILKYAGRGEIVLRSFRSGGGEALEILALDKGPGINDLALARSDGYSTGGSLGAGLGTMARHSTVFDMYSLVGAGTAILSQIIPHSVPVPQIDAGSQSAQQDSVVSVGVMSTPKHGQEVCGDGWATRVVGKVHWLTLLDGLGHGPLAAAASHEAIRVFDGTLANDRPEDVLRRAHEAIKVTRGAVMAVVRIDPGNGTLHFAGVGNIVAIASTGGEIEHFLSTDGTVGYNMRTVRPTDTTWRRGKVFIASTDGLSTRWNLNRHPGLLQKHASLIAAVLHRDFSRESDDATVIVAKAN